MRLLIGIASVLWLWVLPATLATAVIGAVVAITGGNWPWYAWLLLSPLLYVGWMLMFLLFCAPMIRRIATRFPKPRRATVPGKDRGLVTVTACSLRMHLINSLPLVPLIQHSHWGRKLVMRAYSPATHIGKGVQIAGRLTDPESTTIEDFAIVGVNATISAHLWMTSPSGKREYITAPVKVGKHAIVGGGSGVMLGCTIGDYAILQPMSFLQAHTEIPAGEIWGGNPACFQAKRKGYAKTVERVEAAARDGKAAASAELKSVPEG